MLTYNDFDYFKGERLTKEVKVPKKWAMFSSYGNSVLYKKALTLYNKILKEKEGKNREKYYLNSIHSYFKSYERTLKLKKCSEAGDTAVRELVWEFAVKVARSVYIDEEQLENLWNSRY